MTDGITIHLHAGHVLAHCTYGGHPSSANVTRVAPALVARSSLPCAGLPVKQASKPHNGQGGGSCDDWRWGCDWGEDSFLVCLEGRNAMRGGWVVLMTVVLVLAPLLLLPAAAAFEEAGRLKVLSGNPVICGASCC